MDGYNEKKWFIYVGDHHEGPFSLAEIEAKMKENLVTSANFVWCEGMADWKVMTDVSEFSALVHTAPQPPQAPPSSTEAAPPAAPEHDRTSTVISLQSNGPSPAEPDLVESTASESIRIETESPSKSSETGEQRVVLVEQPRVTQTPSGESATKSHGSRGSSLWRGLVFTFKALLVLAVFAGGYLAFTLGYFNAVLKSSAIKAGIQTVTDSAHPYLLKAIERYPQLARWISPIPSLRDVASDEFEELKGAAATPLQPGPPTLAIALSRTNPVSPVFYVATNLPDNAVIDVYLVGVPETLLHQSQFFMATKALITKRLGKTEPVRLPEGQAIPRGQYKIYVMEGEKQPGPVEQILAGTTADPSARANELEPGLPKGRKLAAFKSYFLGGEKDAHYTQALKDYHDLLYSKAVKELQEIKLFKGSLDGQILRSVMKYSQLRKIKGKLGPKQKKDWAVFARQWEGFDAAMEPAFRQWNPATLPGYFYGSLLSLLVQARQAVRSAYDLQNRFFTVGAMQGMDIQIDAAVSNARSVLAQLAAKIEKAEKLGRTPNGMPRRDGL